MMTPTSISTSLQLFQPSSYVFILLRIFKVRFTNWKFSTAVLTTWLAHGRFSSNQDQVCPYSTIESGFNPDKRYKSEFHHLVEFDRGQKPSG